MRFKKERMKKKEIPLQEPVIGPQTPIEPD